MNKQILVVEDEESLRYLLKVNLMAAGFSVLEAGDTFQALQKIQQYHPDLILLDWMLPNEDGLTLLRKIHLCPQTSAIPVIMLTAKSTDDDIVLGLEMGARDYITKPFSNKILIARIKVLLREQADEPQEKIIHYRELTLFTEQYRVLIGKEELPLTQSEFDILALLCMRPGHVYTRNQIITRTKGEYHPVTDRSIDSQIANLRRKLGPLGPCLETIRSIGYRMRLEENTSIK